MNRKKAVGVGGGVILLATVGFVIFGHYTGREGLLGGPRSTDVSSIPKASESVSGAEFRGPMASLGRRLSADVAEVKDVSESGKYSRLIVLEESHGSPLQQIEEAIVLTRAYSKDHLREIVLEGYLIDEPAIKWKTLRDLGTPATRAIVGIRQLETGLFTGAEYVAYVFGDIRLVPGENSNQRPELDTSIESDVLGVVLELGRSRLDRVDAHIVETLLVSLGSSGKSVEERRVLLAKIGELLGPKYPLGEKYISSLMEPVGSSIEREMAVLLELKGDAKAAGVPDKLYESMEKKMSFLASRSAATSTLLKSIQSEDSSSLGALIIGAGHTPGAVAALRERRPFVVLAGKTFGDRHDPSHLGYDKFTSRSKGRPLTIGGISSEIFSAVRSRGGMKESPGLTFDYVRAINELDTILFLSQSGGGGNEPPIVPDSKAAFPFPWFNRMDGFEGEFWKVSASSIAWVDEQGQIVATFDERKSKTWDAKTQMPVGARAIVFDMRLRVGEGLVYTAKVAPAAEGEQIHETIERFRMDLIEGVEHELLAARDRLRNKKPEPEPRTPNVDQRRPSWNHIAALGKSREAVLRTQFK